jgi:hypothetical protein
MVMSQARAFPCVPSKVEARRQTSMKASWTASSAAPPSPMTR